MIAICFPDDSDEPEGVIGWLLPNGEEIYEHPRKLLDDETYLILEAYMHYKNNILPESGGYHDQTAKYLSCMSCCQQWMNKNNGSK